jgi:hypothetical protein
MQPFFACPSICRPTARCPPTGNAATDQPLLVEADDGSDHYEGVVVAGECDRGGH